MQFLEIFFAWLIPPPDAAPLRVYVHRIITGLLLIYILALLVAWNGGPVPSFEAMARQKQVDWRLQQVNRRVDDSNRRLDQNEIVQVKTQLQQNVTDACDAIERRDQRRLSSANSNIDLLADQYFNLTKREFHRPQCEDVVIDWADKGKTLPPAP